MSIDIVGQNYPEYSDKIIYLYDDPVSDHICYQRPPQEGAVEYVRSDIVRELQDRLRAAEETNSTLNIRNADAIGTIANLEIELEHANKRIEDSNSQKPYKYIAPNGELRDSTLAQHEYECGARFKPVYEFPLIPLQQAQDVK